MTIDQRNARDWCRFPGGHQKGVVQGRARKPSVRTTNRLPAVEIVEGSLSDFMNSGLNIYVWPGGLDWAMAFTYENDWFGSYFSRPVWVTAPSR
jgi:hypothetical protein